MPLPDFNIDFLESLEEEASPGAGLNDPRKYVASARSSDREPIAAIADLESGVREMSTRLRAAESLLESAIRLSFGSGVVSAHSWLTLASATVAAAALARSAPAARVHVGGESELLRVLALRLPEVRQIALFRGERKISTDPESVASFLVHTIAELANRRHVERLALLAAHRGSSFVLQLKMMPVEIEDDAGDLENAALGEPLLELSLPHAQ